MKIEKAWNSLSLDSGGILYPYIATKSWAQGFRMEARLDEKVDYETLLQAVDRVRERLPYHFVTLSKSFMQYRLSKFQKTTDILIQQTDQLCAMFHVKDDTQPVVRITYWDDCIGFELFHAVTDGYGASVVLKNILAEYYRVKGETIPEEDGIFSPESQLQVNEIRDSFLDVFFRNNGKSSSRSEPAAYQYNHAKATGTLRLTTFELPIREIKKLASEHHVSVTQYLTALYTKALSGCAEADGSRKPVKVEIPLNMRNRFLSHTLRNFSLYFMTCISPEETRQGIEDILQKMKQQFRSGTDLQKLINDVKANVGQANTPVFRMMPRRLKHLVLKTGTKIYGERLQTTPFSNLGVVKMPAELEQHIKSFGFMIGQTQINTVYAAAVTFRDTLYWDITSVVQEDRIETMLERTLNECGVPYVRCAARTNREADTPEE
ncbi:MAG: hypothetical protein IKW76_09825 [Clostridia bacterium]|nr:hypothetical protein [Clostridia bacterium]